jgi:hypothetical protein
VLCSKYKYTRCMKPICWQRRRVVEMFCCDGPHHASSAYFTTASNSVNKHTSYNAVLTYTSQGCTLPVQAPPYKFINKGAPQDTTQTLVDWLTTASKVNNCFIQSNIFVHRRGVQLIYMLHINSTNQYTWTLISKNWKIV